MILSKEQINRYLRHIIMPEIKGQGQRKLLEATISVYSENVTDTMPLVLYLSAMGIGKIQCHIDDSNGYELLFSQAMDLNVDLIIELKDGEAISDFRIVIGSPHFISKTAKYLNNNKFIPTIFSAINGFKFIIKNIVNLQELNEISGLLSKRTTQTTEFKFASAVSGTICTIEAVKQILGIGNNLKDILYFDLFNLVINEYKLSQAENAMEYFYKYEEFDYTGVKEKLKNAKILIVGAGGLGSPSSLALALAGVGTIGLVDSDTIEASNLNRQVLHGQSRIGMAKAESAKYILNKINPKIKIDAYITQFTKENAQKLIEEYDMVISAVDNIDTRYLINDMCYFLKKPMIEAGILRFDGTSTTIIPDKGHCYRCLYPNLNTSNMSCSENGVLGALPGVMGFIQAMETFKIILGTGTTLRNKILLFDGLEMEFNIISLERNPECPMCGKHLEIKEFYN